MRRPKTLTVFAFASLLIAWGPSISAQQAGKSHEQCLAGLPSDWGTNFGETWRANEAKYWACHLGLPTSTVQSWQRVAGVSEMIQNIWQLRINNREMTLIEETGGDAHCDGFTALVNTAGGWQKAGEIPPPGKDPGMHYCTLTCPDIKLESHGDLLTLELPGASDPNEDLTQSCTHLRWSSESYRWNGRAFVAQIVR